MFGRRLHGLRNSAEGEKLGPVLARALNKNQMLILNAIEKENGTITNVLKAISDTKKIPLSTLKMNAAIIKDLQLAAFGNSHIAILTPLGRLVLHAIENASEKPPHSSIGRAIGCNPMRAGSIPVEGTRIGE